MICVFLGSMGCIFFWSTYWILLLGYANFCVFLGGMGTLALEFFSLFWVLLNQFLPMCFNVGPGFFCLFWILYESFYTSNFLNINDLFGYVIHTNNYVDRGGGTDEDG